ncbi:MAG: hypothetical protein NVSMB1_25090 [Polyangiales bacterium]
MPEELSPPLQRVLEACADPVGARSLMQAALTHRTYVNEHPEHGFADNQRLELLGDAVLELIVTRWLYDALLHADEGLLSRARAAVVNEGALATGARRLQLGKLLRLGRGEDAGGGRDRPRILADALEAVVAAAYLAAGIEGAKVLVDEALGETIACAIREAGAIKEGEKTAIDARVKDAKSVLQELVQREGAAPPSYELTHTEGPVHARVFYVKVMVLGEPLGEGAGRSRREAEMRAASAALMLRAEGGVVEKVAEKVDERVEK